jgi:hypothetical protein
LCLWRAQVDGALSKNPTSYTPDTHLTQDSPTFIHPLAT